MEKDKTRQEQTIWYKGKLKLPPEMLEDQAIKNRSQWNTEDTRNRYSDHKLNQQIWTIIQWF